MWNYAIKLAFKSHFFFCSVYICPIWWSIMMHMCDVFMCLFFLVMSKWCVSMCTIIEHVPVIQNHLMRLSCWIWQYFCDSLFLWKVTCNKWSCVQHCNQNCCSLYTKPLVKIISCWSCCFSHLNTKKSLTIHVIITSIVIFFNVIIISIVIFF